MYNQITLEEIGLIPKQKEPRTDSTTQVKDYACLCGGCICNHCANSVECIDQCTGEAEFGCFSCDECRRYDGKGTDNWREHCGYYKVTESHAKDIRKKFKIFKLEGGE